MKLYLRLLRYLKPYTGRLTLALACMALYAVTNFVSLGMIGPLMRVLFERPASHSASTVSPTGSIDAAPVPRPALPPALDALRARVEGWFLDLGPLAALELTCLVLLVVFLLKNLADYGSSFLMASIEQGVIRDLRGQLQRRLQELSLSFYHARRTGELVSRVTSDMESLRAVLSSSISNFVKDALTLAGALFWVFATSWQLAALSLAVVPPAAVALTVVGHKMRKRSTRAQERMADLTSVLHENLAGMRVVKAFGAEDFERRRFHEVNRDHSRIHVRVRRIAAAAGPVSELAIVLVTVAMLWLGVREIFERQRLGPESFVIFVAALLTTISPVRRMAEMNSGIQQGLAAARRVFGILDIVPAVADRPGARELPRLADRIRFENVSFAYQDGRRVLEDISFEIARGETVALVGPSGAGKSTAADLLIRLYDPTHGRVTLDGIDLRDGTLASLRARFGIVTQETFLFHDTVRANIAYGVAGATDEAVREAARHANAHTFISRMPQGYDTVIGDRGVKLSGGERQRLAIARALLRDPDILLLDEATSALDNESERLAQDALERLMRDRTVLVIAHRLSTVQHADRIVVLERGRVAECGAPAELIRRNGVYARLYRHQFHPLDVA